MPTTIGTGSTTPVNTGSPAWTNPGNVYATDGSSATVSPTASGATSTLQVGGFSDLSGISSTDTLTSVVVRTRASVNSTAQAASLTVQGFLGTTAIGTPQTVAIGTTLSDVDTILPTPTLAQVRDSTFRVQVVATRGGAQARTFTLDSVQVVVTHTSPPVAHPNGPYGYWRDALTNRATKPAIWYAIGDSITEGQGASTRANRWTEKVLAALRTGHPTTGATGSPVGYYPAYYRVYSDSFSWVASHLSSTSGSFTRDEWGVNPGNRHASLAAGASHTFSVTGTSIDVWWLTAPGGGTLTVTVNGTTAATIPTAGTYRGDNRQRVTFASAGTYTVTVAASGATCYFSGWMAYNGDESKGIHLYDSGHTGATAATFTALESGVTKAAMITGLVQPDLVTIGLGSNEANNGVTPATYKTNMQTLISSVRTAAPTASIILVRNYSSAQNSAIWAGYMTAQDELLADNPDVGLIDLFATMGPATTSGTGDFSTDGQHPNNTGHTTIANQIGPALALPASATLTGTPTDAVGATDSATRTLAATRAPADPLPVTDQADRAAASVRTPADPVGLTDSATATLTPAAVAVTRQADDPVSLTDTATATTSTARQASDPLSVTDTATTAAATARQQADPVTVTDAVTTAAGLDRQQADPVTVTDQATATTSSSRTPGDPVGITDAVTVARSLARTITDGVSVIDGDTTQTVDTDQDETDSVSITDTVTPATATGRAPADPVGITDQVSVDVSGASAASRNDPVDIDDTVTVVRSAGISATDPVTVTDSVTAEMTRTPAPGDQVPVTDTVSRDLTATRTATDSATITDDVTVLLTRAGGATIGDPLAVTDQTTTAVGAARNQQDPVDATDSTTADLHAVRTVDDTATITDTVSVTLTIEGAATLADQVAVTDAVTVNLTVVPVLPGRDITLTATVHPSPWTATLTGSTWAAEIDPSPWTATVEAT